MTPSFPVPALSPHQVLERLQAPLASADLPRVTLATGPTALLDEITNALEADATSTSSSLQSFSPAGSRWTIAEIRDALSHVTRTKSPNPVLVVLQHLETLSPRHADPLLKVLEDPTLPVWWLLCATDSSAFSSTIRSRAYEVLHVIPDDHAPGNHDRDKNVLSRLIDSSVPALHALRIATDEDPLPTLLTVREHLSHLALDAASATEVDALRAVLEQIDAAEQSLQLNGRWPPAFANLALSVAPLVSSSPPNPLPLTTAVPPLASTPERPGYGAALDAPLDSRVSYDPTPRWSPPPPLVATRTIRSRTT